MRPAALLTGLTGIVAVLVIVYVGLTAMNLEPHITFGDPNRLVADADTGELAKPQASAVVSAAPTSSLPAAAPAAISAAPSADKPALPTPEAKIPTPTGPAPQSSWGTAPDTVASTTPSTPVAPASPTAPPSVTVESPAKTMVAPPPETASKPVSSTPAAPSPAIAPAPAVAPEPVRPSISPPTIAEAKRTAALPEKAPPAPTVAPIEPVEEAGKSGTADHAIPTPLARPEPPAESEAKSASTPEKPPEPAAPPKTSQQVDEANLPPAAAEAAKKPGASEDASKLEAPSDTQISKLEPNADLKPVDLSRPLAERAGVLTIGNRVIQLAGITPTDPAQSCTGPNGKEWPCGTLARTALRAFLLGRTITCDVPDPEWKGPVTAECRFAKVSLSDWLARNGWAEPAAGSPLTAVADEARKDGRGIYGNDPRTEHKSTLAPTPPPEDPLNPI